MIEYEDDDDLVTKLVIDAQAVCEGISELERREGKYVRGVKQRGNMFYRVLYEQLVLPNTTTRQEAVQLFDLMKYNELIYQCVASKGLKKTMQVLNKFVNNEILDLDESQHAETAKQLKPL